jgi:hypothetical protein
LPTQPVGFWKRLKEIDMFFAGADPVHQTMRRVVEKLEGAGIPYAVVGGMAVNAHCHRRTTNDVDVLLTAEGFAAFRRLFVEADYESIPDRKRRFIDRANRVNVDVLVTGLFPGSGRPGPISYPDPVDVNETIDDIRFVNLVTLVQLKLAARRYQDFGDVVALIRANDLDEAFADGLDPTVRGDYVECLEEKRREDEYDARQ